MFPDVCVAGVRIFGLGSISKIEWCDWKVLERSPCLSLSPEVGPDSSPAPHMEGSLFRGEDLRALPVDNWDQIEGFNMEKFYFLRSRHQLTVKIW